MAFSEEERRSRHVAMVDIIKRKKLKALVLIGGGTVGPSFYGDYRYYADNRVIFYRQVAVIFPDAEPVILAGSAISQQSCALRTSVRDCRIANDIVSDLAALLKARGIESGTVGVGMEMLSAGWFLSLRKALPSVEWYDVHQDVMVCRYRKTAEEVALYRRAAPLSDMGFDRAIKMIRPGVTEFEIAAEIEYPARAAGAEEFFTLIASGPFAQRGNGLPLPYAPTGRKIERGDTVVMEVTPRFGGYWTQLVRSVNVGKPNDQLTPLYEASRDAIKSGLEVLRPGNTVRDVVTAMGRHVEKCGLVMGPPLGHICDVDLLVDRVAAANEMVLTPGTAIILHPTVYTQDKKTSFFWGETYLITDDGYERLQKSTDELLTV